MQMCRCQCRVQIKVPQTDSCLVKAMELLTADTMDHIRRVLHRQYRSYERYYSFMDWLFCVVFPGERQNCFEFYEDEGPSLEELYPEEIIEQYDYKMCVVIEQLLEAPKYPQAKEVLESVSA